MFVHVRKPIEREHARRLRQAGTPYKRIANERYWLDALSLPLPCLRKAAANMLPRSSTGQAKGKLPYGVATLTVNSTRVVQHIFGAIQEYGDFKEPRWLG